MHVEARGCCWDLASIAFPLFIEAGSFSQTQSSLIWLVLLWALLPLPAKAGITGGLPCPFGTCVGPEEQDVGPHAGVPSAFISEPFPQPPVFCNDKL